MRISPNEVSFATVEAQNAIHRPYAAHRVNKIRADSGDEEPVFFGKHGTLEAMMGRVIWPAKNLLTVTRPEEHRQLKRALQPAFTEPALRKQEPIQQQHTDHMCARILKISQSSMTEDGKARMDLTPFVTQVIWDIISDLSFGHPLPRDQFGRSIHSAIHCSVFISNCTHRKVRETQDHILQPCTSSRNPAMRSCHSGGRLVVLAVRQHHCLGVQTMAPCGIGSNCYA